MAVFYVTCISVAKTLISISNCIKVFDSTDIFRRHSLLLLGGRHEFKMLPRVSFHSCRSDWISISHRVFSGLPAIDAYIIIKSVDTQNYKQDWIYDTMGFVYRSYRPQCIFWESVILLRKVSIAAVVVFAYPLGFDLQVVVCVFVLASALYSQLVCRPFRPEV